MSPVEARVLGALWEKELTTPDYYPLSLHALVAACNQKSNRDPVMTLDENAVKQAMGMLEKHEFAGAADTMDSRVTKYEHRLGEAFNFGRREAAVMCELLLRGPQTPGELRSRASRMHPPGAADRALFDDLDAVQSTLHALMHREPPLVKILPRQPGTKEARYAQLLSQEAAAPEVTAPEPSAASTNARVAPGVRSARTGNTSAESGENGAESERLARLEEEVAALREEISSLKQQVVDFRKQFE